MFPTPIGLAVVKVPAGAAGAADPLALLDTCSTPYSAGAAGTTHSIVLIADRLRDLGLPGSKLPTMAAKVLKQALFSRSPRWPKQRDTAIELTVEPAANGQPATFAIIPSTFEADQECRFRLHIWASLSHRLGTVQPICACLPLLRAPLRPLISMTQHRPVD